MHTEDQPKKQPWPTKNAMEQVYTMKLWGDNNADFYSGEGSHLPEIVQPYITAITTFLTSFNQPLTICDLGCGDFNVGKELVQYTKKYLAFDIVPDLITRNKETFQAENLEFHCLDIAADELPVGDCAILRQVLQHLSNVEIQRILNKLTVYNYVIVTEHIPNEAFNPNIDIISGQGTRLKKQSGVNLLSPPFNFKVKNKKELLSLDLGTNKGVIVTEVYEIEKRSH